jgi:hypothetical protein
LLGSIASTLTLAGASGAVTPPLAARQLAGESMPEQAQDQW